MLVRRHHLLPQEILLTRTRATIRKRRQAPQRQR
jgi:hypothetical protein